MFIKRQVLQLKLIWTEKHICKMAYKNGSTDEILLFDQSPGSSGGLPMIAVMLV